MRIRRARPAPGTPAAPRTVSMSCTHVSIRRACLVQLAILVGVRSTHAFGSGGPADSRWDATGTVEPWPSALPIPEHAGDHGTATRATRAMVGTHPSALEGRPEVNLETPNLKWLHVDPPVLIVDDFISDAECDEILRLTTAQPPADAGRIIQLESRSYADGGPESSSTDTDNNHRISTTWYVRYGCDAVAPLLGGLTDLLPKVKVEQVEEVQLVRYAGSGQGFGWHEDALDKGLATPENGGQRVATLLIYLNECDGGGRTLFRDLVGDNTMRLGVKPKKGRALLFFPSVTGNTALGDSALVADSGVTFGGELFDRTRSDRRTSHAGEPPSGPTGRREKYIAQLWIHAAEHTPVVFGPGLNKQSEARTNMSATRVPTRPS
mmetsp:Transcript_3724/g.10579  ORF Transcript_3724/g.10579 Transcript_3724/m.10579 type:complete len:380 (+) Transcript_3724:149-1288(+)